MGWNVDTKKGYSSAGGWIKGDVLGKMMPWSKVWVDTITWLYDGSGFSHITVNSVTGRRVNPFKPT